MPHNKCSLITKVFMGKHLQLHLLTNTQNKKKQLRVILTMLSLTGLAWGRGKLKFNYVLQCFHGGGSYIFSLREDVKL